MAALDLNDRSISSFGVQLNDRFGFDSPDLQDRNDAKSFGHRSIKWLWEACALSADDFAEEVATFFGYPPDYACGIDGGDILRGAVRSTFFCAKRQFFRSGPAKGNTGSRSLIQLTWRRRKVPQIVLGGHVTVSVASFEEIAAVLSERLGPDEEQAACSANSGQRPSGHAKGSDSTPPSGAPADQSNVESNQARRIGPHVEAVEKALADTGSQMFAKRRIASAAASAAMSAPAGSADPDSSGLISSACAPTGVATTASPCASPRAPTSPALPRVRAAPECPRPAFGCRCGLINPAKKGHSLRYCSPTATRREQGLEKQPNHAARPLIQRPTVVRHQSQPPRRCVWSHIGRARS